MDFLVLFEFVFLSILFAATVCLFSLALQEKKTCNTAKKEQEKEIQKLDNTETQFMPRFFAYTICFLLFLALCALMFPFAYISRGLDLFCIFEIMIFILVLIFALLFGIKSGLFELD